MFESQFNNVATQVSKRAMFLKKFTLLFPLMSPVIFLGQEQRPALIPLQQSGAPGAGASLSSGSGIGGLTDEPISAGEVVHVSVFDAPDLSITARVSESGDVPYPILGAVHFAGLNSDTASRLIANQLKERNLMLNPEVTVTVDATTTGITILGEVRSPGIYSPPGKHLLSDLLATAGGLTANTGRLIEISNNRTPDHKTYVPWDPTMHNTSNFDRLVFPGDRVLVRACGIAYVGGNVAKPGAYSLCGSPQMTLSEVVALAGGVLPSSSLNHTYLVRGQPDGTRVVQQIDVKKVLTSHISDPIVHEDDIIYVSPSPLKAVLKGAVSFALALTPSLIYIYHQ